MKIVHKNAMDKAFKLGFESAKSKKPRNHFLDVDFHEVIHINHIYTLHGMAEMYEVWEKGFDSYEIDYFAWRLEQVWNMGVGKNPLDYSSMAKCMVEDLITLHK